MKHSHLLKQVISVLALCCMLLCQSIVVNAVSQTPLHLELENYQEVRSSLNGQLTGHHLTVWKLEKPYTIDQQKEIVQELRAWDETKLNQEFVASKHDMVFFENHIEVAAIPNGLYYVRDIIKTPTVEYRGDIVFELTDGEVTPHKIFVKKANPTSTIVKLLKTDEHKKPLAKVGFRLARMEDNQEEIGMPLIGSDGTYRYDETVSTDDKVLYTDDNGEITVTNLPYGTYRFIEVEPLEGYQIEQPYYEFHLTGPQLVTVVVVNKKTPYGDMQFAKVDSKTNKALANAVFRVTKKVDDKFIPVLQDGKELVLTSSETGRFEAKNLPFGTYYIWEINAPSGYIQLTEPISFIINEEGANEKFTKTVVVRNTKRPSIEVPNTGDITLYLLMFLSAVLFGGGFYLVRKP
ncbi:LPXTG cell wall anchor domain-containing protein [Streptococcus moroccensis]|uniref:LPXTG-motif cell wall-anchored protein n=1 Tax=Streptococcus moroccensis TaxID=1451356 RepID=A0ABT9YTW0_9STRE|nr:LPXTG cell wall anchor domain-containing protein [Streptococcus moroccensis]MDQ0223434.1 LPXTG-motif cell wall-anchored protein [Streptococcus moroccensis]